MYNLPDDINKLKYVDNFKNIIKSYFDELMLFHSLTCTYSINELQMDICENKLKIDITFLNITHKKILENALKYNDKSIDYMGNKMKIDHYVINDNNIILIISKD